MNEGGQALRLDKWLWHARFYRSRSLASRMCAERRIRCSGRLVTKAHHAVRPGDVLTFALGPHIRVVRVVDLGHRRGPAVEARALYEDLAPPAPLEASSPGARQRGAGRPSKRERRLIDRFLGDGSE